MEKMQDPSLHNMTCPYEERTGNCLAKGMCMYKHALNINALKFEPSKKSGEKAEAPIAAPIYYQPQMMPQMDYDENYENYDDYDQGDYFDEFKDCDCCHGYVYSCEGKVCKDMGQCKCKMAAEIESQGSY